jgi:hypothetical protein
VSLGFNRIVILIAETVADKQQTILDGLAATICRLN